VGKRRYGLRKHAVLLGVCSNDTPAQGNIFSEVTKSGISFNKREAKVYCYAFLHVLKRDACIKHEQTKN
jgi:hypothetical protein